MNNPCQAYRNTVCESCNEEIMEGDDLYFHDEEKLCELCAEQLDIVCDCGNYKKPDYEECYECSKNG